MTGQLDYRQLTNSELIPLVELPTELDGLRYYLTKAAKIELLEGGVSPERTAELLAAAQTRREEHHAHLRRRREEGPPDKAVQIEAKLGNEPWSYIEQQRDEGGFRDACTNRKATVAYVLRNEAGVELRVTRATVEHAHAQLRPIANWPPPRGRRPLHSREARAAGLVTLADI